MATRTIRLLFSVVANALGIELTNAPLAPPSGVKWTVVELRPFFQGRGRVFGKFDTELYHEIDQRDVVQYGMPHQVALDIVQPHKYDVFVDDESGFANAGGEDVVIEESPLTA